MQLQSYAEGAASHYDLRSQLEILQEFGITLWSIARARNTVTPTHCLNAHRITRSANHCIPMSVEVRIGNQLVDQSRKQRWPNINTTSTPPFDWLHAQNQDPDIAFVRNLVDTGSGKPSSESISARSADVETLSAQFGHLRSMDGTLCRKRLHPESTIARIKDCTIRRATKPGTLTFIGVSQKATWELDIRYVRYKKDSTGQDGPRTLVAQLNS